MTSTQRIEAIWAALAAGSVFFARINGKVVWIDTADRSRFRRAFGGIEQVGGHAQLSPFGRDYESDLAPGKSSCLWARIESGKQLQALTRFSPCPTIVLRDGTTLRRTAIWALTGELDQYQTERLCKRIAHRLGTPKKYANPETFLFSMPGATGEGDKTIHIEHMSPDFYGAREVAGHLAEPPDPNAWRQAA